MKLIDIIRTAAANMLRSKVRTGLTIVAIFVGSLTLTLTNGIGSGVSSYIDRQLGNLGAEDVLLVQPAQTFSLPGSSSEPKKYDPNKEASGALGGLGQNVLKDSDIAKLKTFDGIEEVTPSKVKSPDYIEGKNNKKYQIMASEDIEGAHYDLAAGRGVSLKSSQPEIMLPSDYTKALGYQNPKDIVGRTVKLGVTDPMGQKAVFSGTVVGVLNKGLTDSGGAALNYALNNVLYDYQTKGLPEQLKRQYPMAFARFDKSLDTAAVAKLKENLTKAGYDAQTLQDTVGVFKQVIAGITAVLVFFAAIALLAASFGIINTLYMAVQERTKEIGLMKAMGMRRSRIFLLFSIEAALIGFWGSVLGVLTAVGIGQLVNHLVSTTIFKDLPSFTLLTFPPAAIVKTILLIMAIAFLAGTLPARRAAKQNPIDALRYE
jgi:putative ABC transport system permease protein